MSVRIINHGLDDLFRIFTKAGRIYLVGFFSVIKCLSLRVQFVCYKFDALNNVWVRLSKVRCKIISVRIKIPEICKILQSAKIFSNDLFF